MQLSRVSSTIRLTQQYQRVHRAWISSSRASSSLTTYRVSATSGRYWQEMYDKKRGKYYYIETDTKEIQDEKPHEYVPFSALESKAMRYLRSDGIAAIPYSKPMWVYQLAWASFAVGMVWLGYNIYEGKKEDKAREEEQRSRNEQNTRRIKAILERRREQKGQATTTDE